MRGDGQLNGLPRMRAEAPKIDIGDLVLHVPAGKRGIVVEIQDAPWKAWNIGVQYDDQDHICWYAREELLLIQKEAVNA